MKRKEWVCGVLAVSALCVAARAESRPAASLQEPGPFKIDADFPGGNVTVESIEAERAVLSPDFRDTEGWWFYWYFRVTGAAGRRVTFVFPPRNPIGVHGPAVSTDGGASWTWLGNESVEGTSFSYEFPADAGEVRFSVTMPYTGSNLKAFVDKHSDNRHIKAGQLTRSRKGRAVPMIRLGQLHAEPVHRVLLSARTHACETMASYLLEGIMEGVLTAPDHEWLRENVEFLAIPFVDTDGVEDGDQGKNRRPHDHNRDFRYESIYPEVEAMREFVPRWSDGRLRIALDLHCPGLRGGGNETFFFVGPPGRDHGQEPRALFFHPGRPVWPGAATLREGQPLVRHDLERCRTVREGHYREPLGLGVARRSACRHPGGALCQCSRQDGDGRVCQSLRQKHGVGCLGLSSRD